jgi:hypothetical protein
MSDYLTDPNAWGTALLIGALALARYYGRTPQ